MIRMQATFTRAVTAGRAARAAARIGSFNLGGSLKRRGRNGMSKHRWLRAAVFTIDRRASSARRAPGFLFMESSTP